DVGVVAGHFEGGEVGPRMLQYARHRQLIAAHAIVQFEIDLHLFPAIIVGYWDDGGLAHFGQHADHCLYLLSGNVFSIAAHHVLDAAHDAEVSIGILDEEIARAEPVIAKHFAGRLFVPVVAKHQACAAYAELTRLTIRHRIPFQVEHADCADGARNPARTRLVVRRPDIPGQVQCATDFGHAVELLHRRVEQRFEVLRRGGAEPEDRGELEYVLLLLERKALLVGHFEHGAVIAFISDKVRHEALRAGLAGNDQFRAHQQSVHQQPLAHHVIETLAKIDPLHHIPE